MKYPRSRINNPNVYLHILQTDHINIIIHYIIHWMYIYIYKFLSLLTIIISIFDLFLYSHTVQTHIFQQNVLV